MKKLFTTILLILMLATSAAAYDTYVNGYQKSDGSQVQGYYRTSPNSTVKDNYSYHGNVNPYTGSTGDNYYRNSPSSDYYNGGLNNNNRSSDPFGTNSRKNR